MVTEAQRAYSRAYYRCNKDKQLTAARARYQSKKEEPEFRKKQSAATKKYTRTKRGWLKQSYIHQIQRSVKRGMNLPTYTVEELEDWRKHNTNFDVMYQTWVDAGYLTAIKPSIDRINPLKSYTLDNIQLLTWGENHEKSRKDIALLYAFAKQYSEDFIEAFGTYLRAYYDRGEE